MGERPVGGVEMGARSLGKGSSRGLIPQGGELLVWWLKGIQKLLGERIDLVSASNFVGQQRQFDDVEIFVKVLHLLETNTFICIRSHVQYLAIAKTIKYNSHSSDF